MDGELVRVIIEAIKPEMVEGVKEILREMAPMQTNQITVYTVAEAAKLLKTSREQILAYIRCKKLKSFKLERDSRTNLIHADDLTALIELLRETS